MKKFIGICGVMLVLASCGGSKGANTGEETGNMYDSALTAEQISEVAGQTDYVLTADSIGGVHVGEAISALPAAIPNLYDMMIVTETPDAMAYTFLLGNVEQFTVYDFMEGNVDVIALEGNSRGVATPEGVLRVGDSFDKVLKLRGVQSDWAGIDEDGIWYWKWNGLYFGVEETDLPEELGNALCDSKRPPRANLFTPDIKIGYIATGLPF